MGSGQWPVHRGRGSAQWVGGGGCLKGANNSIFPPMFCIFFYTFFLRWFLAVCVLPRRRFLNSLCLPLSLTLLLSPYHLSRRPVAYLIKTVGATLQRAASENVIWFLEFSFFFSERERENRIRGVNWIFIWRKSYRKNRKAKTKGEIEKESERERESRESKCFYCELRLFF